MRDLAWTTLLLLSAIPGCALFHPTTRPIPTLWYRAEVPAAGPRSLLVLWPGRGDAPEDFARAGIVEVIQREAPGVDVVAVDAHFGYYLEQSAITRVLEDVVMPARGQGYARVILVGVSMGGLGVLMFQNEHPEAVDAVLALAPFLGDDEVLDEIRAAGGLAGWNPPSPPDRQDYQRALWYGLRRQLDPTSRPPVYLGFGEEDRFRAACELLSAVLPADRVFRAPGGHEWEPWRALLASFLRAFGG